MSNNNEVVKSPRFLNGYRLVYLPDHPASMKSENWKGYVYEHIVIAEETIGRRISDKEVVHHLNGDRSFNLRHNLIVLERSQHAALHLWINSGAPIVESDRENGENSEKPKFTADFNRSMSYCKQCKIVLQDNNNSFCSDKCFKLSLRKVTRPTKEKLLEDVENLPMTKIGKKYGVSDNSVRKWLKAYGVNKAILSRALNTSREGAETSGEV